MLGAFTKQASGDGGRPHAKGSIDTFKGWTHCPVTFVDVIVELIPRWYRALSTLADSRGAFYLLIGRKRSRRE